MKAPPTQAAEESRRGASAPLDVERVPCPLCGADEVEPILGRDGWTMGRCAECEFVRQQPRVTEAWIVAHDYDRPTERPAQPRRARDVGAGLQPWESKPREAYLPCLAVVERVRANEAAKGRWLDVGCQTGGLLVAAREQGWTPLGVDVDRRSAAFCRDHHGMDVRDGTLAEAAFPAQSADVVSYRQVLEHVHDLAAELAEAKRVLAPNALLLVEVPHLGGMKYRIDRLRCALGHMDRGRLLHNVPQHLYYFRAKDLTRLLDRAGFDVVSMTTYGKYRVRPSWPRRFYASLRDRLRIGNKLRCVARRRAA